MRPNLHLPRAHPPVPHTNVCCEMSNTYKIWCFIEGGTNPFILTPSSTTKIILVKKMIKEKFRDDLLKGIDYNTLTLWKARYFL
jgi:hypothetical protein